MGESVPHLDTGPVNSFRPDDTLFDAPYEEPQYPVDGGVMSEGDRKYYAKVLEINPDESFLSTEQEQELSQKVQLGLVAAKALLHREPTDPGYDQLLIEAAEGQAARDELVVTNLRLAAWLVRETMNLNKERSLNGQRLRVQGKIVIDLGSLSGGPLGYDDRMQVATAALIRAAEKYDGSRGSFTTHALWVMEPELIRAIGSVELPMRLPASQSNSLNRLKRSREDMALSGNLDPTYSELGEIMDVSPFTVAELDGLGVTTQHVSFEQLAEKLDALRSNETDDGTPSEDLTVADVLVDSETDEYSEASNLAALHELGQRIDKVLSGLSEREQQVIIMSFGLEGGEPMTRQDIAPYFGLTRERIRQIEVRALGILRNPKKSSQLRHDLYMQDPQYGLRPEISLSADEDTALGISKLRPRSEGVFAWEKTPGYAQAKVQTYTLEEYNRTKGN